MSINVVGIDPGPACGIVLLRWQDCNRCQPSRPGRPACHAYQCDAASARGLLGMLLSYTLPPGEVWTAGGIEEFRRGNRSTQLAHASDGNITGRLVTELTALAADHGVRLACRPAATVKPWASDKRMQAAGLLAAIPAKMIDARSAGQIALYSAVSDAGVPDPLSRRAAPA